jgi:hypothetical protein
MTSSESYQPRAEHKFSFGLRAGNIAHYVVALHSSLRRDESCERYDGSLRP